MITVPAERPILFSPEMVRAILDGRKTQTRRVVSARNSTVNGYPANAKHDALEWADGWKNLCFDSRVYADGVATGPSVTCGISIGSGKYLHVPLLTAEDGDKRWYRVRCRMEPGDRLWVREAWCYWGAISDPISDSAIAFRADADMAGVRWRSPIHMHRWAARIFLEIVSVRVERVQSITREDAKAEGIPEYRHQLSPEYTEAELDEWRNRTTIENFASLWDRINGKRAPWESNPWVWVIEFRRAA